MRERRYGAKGERACKPNCKFSVSRIISILISILISIWKFAEWGRETCGRGNAKGASVFFSVFRGLSPRSLTRKPTYNKTCNPTYNPSYCPHTSAVARGGTAIGAFGTAELRLGKRGGEEQSFWWS